MGSFERGEGLYRTQIHNCVPQGRQGICGGWLCMDRILHPSSGVISCPNATPEMTVEPKRTEASEKYGTLVTDPEEDRRTRSSVVSGHGVSWTKNTSALNDCDLIKRPHTQ